MPKRGARFAATSWKSDKPDWKEPSMSEWKPDICIYHGGCDDGFGAALAVHMRWGDAE